MDAADKQVQRIEVLPATSAQGGPYPRPQSPALQCGAGSDNGNSSYSG